MNRYKVQFPLWLLVAAMVIVTAAMSLAGWYAGMAVQEIRDVGLVLDARAEARAAEVEQLHTDIETLKDDIRDEIQNPAGARADTHEAARQAVEAMHALNRKLDLLLEAQGVDPDEGEGG